MFYFPFQHHIANEPLEAKENIYNMFEREFAATEMVCIFENLFDDGEWDAGMERPARPTDSCGVKYSVEFNNFQIPLDKDITL